MNPTQPATNASAMHYAATGQGNAVKCKGCPVRFVPTRHWQEFCSKGCRTRFHARDDRGPEPTQTERITALEQEVKTLRQQVARLLTAGNMTP